MGLFSLAGYEKMLVIFYLNSIVHSYIKIAIYISKINFYNVKCGIFFAFFILLKYAIDPKSLHIKFTCKNCY